MSRPARTVLADALQLDVKARAHIASELIASLDGPADPDADAACAEEIERRVEDIKCGSARLEAWSDVKQRIERTIRGR